MAYETSICRDNTSTLKRRHEAATSILSEPTQFTPSNRKAGGREESGLTERGRKREDRWLPCEIYNGRVM